MSIGTDRPVVAEEPLSPGKLAAKAAVLLRERQDRAVVTGGELVANVTLLGPEAPPPADVVVPLVPVTRYHEFLVHQADEARLIGLVCARPEAWPEDWPQRLTPASHARLIESVMALNFPWVIAWADRQRVVTESMLPLPVAGSPSAPPSSARGRESS